MKQEVFYTRAKGEPTDIYKMIGEKGNRVGRLVIVDLQDYLMMLNKLLRL